MPGGEPPSEVAIWSGTYPRVSKFGIGAGVTQLLDSREKLAANSKIEERLAEMLLT